MENKTVELLNSLNFTEVQIQTLKSIVIEGFWGDTDMDFEDGETYYSYGYCTNLKGGKTHSGIMSGISKKLKESKTNLISMCSDWWGDGAKDGDMMFFNMELLDSDELTNWASE